MKYFLLLGFVMSFVVRAQADATGEEIQVQEADSSGEVYQTLDEDYPTEFGNSDLIVKSIRFSKRSGEFGGSSQLVSIIVQNIGKQYVQNPACKVTLKGQIYSASVYGPGQVAGQFLLGARIYPGTQGQLLVYLPDNTIKHCERVAGVIDSEHRLQYGYGNPFQNDSLATVMAVDTQSIRACLGDVIRR